MSFFEYCQYIAWLKLEGKTFKILMKISIRVTIDSLRCYNNTFKLYALGDILPFD